LFKYNLKAEIGSATAAEWKATANCDLFHVFTEEEPVEEHFEADRTQQE